MRYTRYDYKKKNNGSFLFWLLATIILSVLIGMVFFNLFLRDDSEGIEVENTNNESAEISEKQESTIKSFGIIQCGVYKNKENADATITKIPSEYTSFVIEDSGSLKVIAGIFTLDDADKKTEELNTSSISSFRIKCDIHENTDSNKANAEIIDGYIKVINKLEDKSIKSISSKEFKAWVQEIYNNVKEKDDILEELENNIQSLPDEYSKENSKESLNLLYSILIKYK